MAGSSLLGAGASSALNFASTRYFNRQAAGLSSAQMAFQKMMSDTAHQREVADLRAAGLNPILSGTGGAGASSPSGSMAPVTHAQPVNTGLAYAMQKKQRHILDNQARLLQAQEFQANSDAQLKDSQNVTEIARQSKEANMAVEAAWRGFSAREDAEKAALIKQMTQIELEIAQAGKAGLKDQAAMLGERWYMLKRRLDAGLDTTSKATGAAATAAGTFGALSVGRQVGRKLKNLWGGHGSASRKWSEPYLRRDPRAAPGIPRPLN